MSGNNAYPQNTGFAGPLDYADGATDFNALSFMIEQAMNGAAIATLVRVQAVTNSGGLAPAGYVDVLPLVNQIDGNGNATPHGTVHHLPYARIQGGNSAVILDPVVGDVGICIFADRDISAVKANKAQANPGSARRNSMADGMYVGGVLNGTPTQYVGMNAGGISIVSPTQVFIQAPTIQLNGVISQTGSLAGAATIQGPLVVVNDATISGRGFLAHEHTGVTTGAGNTGTVV